MNRRLGITVSAAVVAYTAALVAWTAGQLPAGNVPVHWDAVGRPNSYGSRETAILGLLIVPMVVVLLTALFAAIPVLEPRRSNLLRSARAYMATWVAVMLLFAVVQTAIVLSTLRPEMAGVLPRLILGALGLLFVVIGNYLGKIRSNFFFGVRTPWTLSSELSWNRTHRLGGRLMIAFGLVLAATAGFASSFAWVAVLLGGIAVLLVVMLVYSYLVWRDDPQKLPLGR